MPHPDSRPAPLSNLPQAGKPSALDLTESTAAADECDGTSHRDSRKDLKEVPGGIVQEEDALDGKEGAEEDCVGKGCRLESSREVVQVDAEDQPLYQRRISPPSMRQQRRTTYHSAQNRKGSKHQSEEDQGDDQGRTLSIGLEDVMDLRKLSVARRLDGGHRLVGVPGHRQLECSSVVGVGLAKGSDQDSRIKGLGDGKELNGQVLLGLACTSALFHPVQSCGISTDQLNSGFAIILHAEGVGDIQSGLRVLEKEENLVRAFGGAAFLGCQSHLQGVGRSEGDRLGESFVVGNSVNGTSRLAF